MLRVKTIGTGEGTEHENTTTEGTIARKQFTADELQVGQVWDFHCAVVVNDNNSTDTLTLAIRFGTSSTVTSNTAIGTSAAVDSADADFAVIWGRIEVQTATRVVISGFLSAADAANVEKACAFYAPFTIAAGTAHVLDITADWSVAHADNEVAAAGFHVLQMV
jgi:hypothetical protein